MLTRLAEPALYAAAFATVAAKERERQSDECALEGAPSLAGLTPEVDALARRLAQLVPACRYELSPVMPRRVLIEGKQRILFHSPPLDRVVMTALSSVLGESLAKVYSDRLFSYRPGRSNRHALLQLSEFAKSHRACLRDPKQRGLYILRRDVKSYGDNIPSDPDSRLWEILKSALATAGTSLEKPAWEWVVRAIKPPVAANDLGLDAGRGIPTGSPLQPLMANLYLTDLDRACEVLPEAFYARYGDDLIFAHADEEVARGVAELIDRTILELKLRWSEGKSSNLYLTAAGRTSSTDGYRAVTSVDYLGARMDARGELGLNHAKVARLLSSVTRRLEDAARICEGDAFEVRARTYCSVVNAALDPLHPVAERAAQLLRHVVTDRGQLKHLDYQIALRIAERLTDQRGVRAFRTVPMHLLKERYGLRSLVVERNRVDHARRHA